MTAAEKYADLNAAVDQAQATLDRRRQHLERAVRYFDECPDGDRRKADAEARVSRLLADKNLAETAAMAAVDALLEFEAQHPEVVHALTRPSVGDLDVTVRTLDWLAALVEEQDRPEIGDALTMARAFAAATRAHS